MVVSGKEMLSHLYKKTGKVNKAMILYRKTNTKLFFYLWLNLFRILALDTSCSELLHTEGAPSSAIFSNFVYLRGTDHFFETLSVNSVHALINPRIHFFLLKSVFRPKNLFLSLCSCQHFLFASAC